MSEHKKYQDKNVLEAARDRLRYTFAELDHVYLSVSAGKDSSVMMQLAAEIARETDSQFDVLFIDLEAQYQATIEHFEDLLELCDDVVDTVYWCCLPLSLRNAVSQIQPKWTCWGKEAEDKWVREMPTHECVLTEDDNPFDFFEPQMEFEDFIDGFAEWYDNTHDGDTAAGVGIRSDESLNRFRSLTSDTKQPTV